jgi:hypothetical protein
MIAYIEAQGSLLRVRQLCKPPRESHGGGIRGRIHKFSIKSRQRLMRLFARMKYRNVRATFITLTFAKYPTNREAKRSLKAFVQYLRDNFEGVSAVWRLEYQGRGSIHFHLLCFNLPYWSWKDLLATWKSCSNQGRARIDIRLVKSKRGVMHYVSKYISKPDELKSSTFFIHAPYQQKGRHYRKGRFWGYVNKRALPFDEVVEGLLTNEKEIRRLSNAAWEIVGSDSRYGSISFHLFYDKAKQLAMRNIEAFGHYLDEWGYNLRDHIRRPKQYGSAEDHFSEQQLEKSDRLSLGKLYKGERREACEPLTVYRTTASYRLVAETGELVERIKM